MSPSKRAAGRVYDLRKRTIERLQSHTPLVNLLELVVSDATEVVVPQWRNRRWHNDNDGTVGEPPDIVVAVGVVTGSSQRENAMERKNMTVQTEVEAAYDVDETLSDSGNGLAPWYDRVRDEVSAVMTSHDGEWIAQGEAGGSPEPLTRPERERYAVVQRFDVQNFGN